MLQRVLSVSFAQVLRSIALLLFPLAFIALIAWTTAGSTSGNTSDPIRAALWLWLGAHHVPFSLTLAPASTAGFFSYLPMGAILLPFFCIRYGFNRALDRLHGDIGALTPVRLIFSSLYALLATLVALVAKSPGVEPVLLLAPVMAFIISYLSTLTCAAPSRISKPVAFASRLVAIIFGSGFVGLSILIFMNVSTISNIRTVLEPGFFGGILLFILNVLYLPNAAISALSYFSGAGFAVGNNTVISPFSYDIGSVPAFPLFGALPTSSSRLALIALIVIVGAGTLLASWTISLNTQVLIQSLFLVIISIALLGYLGGGSLMTDGMGSIGPSVWKFTLALSLEIALGAVLLLGLPVLRLKAFRR